MYRIMLPTGRLVSSSEVIFVRRDKDTYQLSSCTVDQANAMIFKTPSGKCWCIYGLDLYIKSIGLGLLKYGYIRLPNGIGVAYTISESRYFELSTANY